MAANIALLQAPETPTLTASGALSGEITQEIDSLYRENLPHKDPSVGLVGAMRYALLNEGRNGVVVGTDSVLFTSEETRPVDGATYAAAVAAVAHAADTLAETGVSLVVVPLPAKIDILRDFAPDQDAATAQADLYKTFMDDLAARGIPTVDTKPDLARHRHPFLKTDTHCTQSGARTVAQTIAESGHVARGTDTFVIHSDDAAHFAGYLVSYVTTDWLGPKVGLDSIELRPFKAIAQEDAAGGLLDLFGDAGGGVDLVGTSYSANPNWSFAEALKIALRRDVINHAEEGRGPFLPMLDYLTRLDPLSPPETVIWEIPVRYLTDAALVGPQVAG